MLLSEGASVLNSSNQKRVCLALQIQQLSLIKGIAESCQDIVSGLFEQLTFDSGFFSPI